MEDSTSSRSSRGRSTYESFLKEVVKDFDRKVLKVQEVAEYNCSKYEAHCQEVKFALHEVQRTLQLLQGAMNAQLLHEDNLQYTYSCMVVEGALAGHKFTLTCDASRGDYFYDPSQSPCQPHLAQLKQFLSRQFYFPKTMLSRFIANIQFTTYSTSVLSQ